MKYLLNLFIKFLGAPVITTIGYKTNSVISEILIHKIHVLTIILSTLIFSKLPAPSRISNMPQNKKGCKLFIKNFMP